MKRDLTATLGIGSVTLRAQRASSTSLSWKLEVSVSTMANQVGGHRAGGTATAHGLKINHKSVLAEEAVLAMPGRLRHQIDSERLELKPALGAAVGAVRQHLFNFEPARFAARLDQLNRILVILGAARHHIYRGYQWFFGVDRQPQLVAIETNPLALPTMAHLGVVHRGDALGAGAPANRRIAVCLALHILQEQFAE